jgi:hypothetical protein
MAEGDGNVLIAMLRFNYDIICVTTYNIMAIIFLYRPK